MPPLHLLIKPVSGQCNLRCDYCFYADEANNRGVKSYGEMSLSTLESLVSEAFGYEAADSVTFAFQGGEPTLIGLDFYKSLISFANEYNVRKKPVSYAIQTNGTLIDDAFAGFFAENKFLVGLSLDGGKEINDGHRTYPEGGGSYAGVINAAATFDRHGVDYNILTVVTAQVAKHIGKIYGFFKKNNFLYQQYIPCLDPFGEPRGARPYSLTPALYGFFLKTLFDLWYRDIKNGVKVYIRYFENLAGVIKGYMPESCGMSGHCSFQHVVEADGSVYPCDFYAMDGYLIGRIGEGGFEKINGGEKRREFIEKSLHRDAKCDSCKWLALCGGGCRRDREPVVDGRLSLNYYCEAVKDFYEYSYGRMKELLS